MVMITAVAVVAFTANNFDTQMVVVEVVNMRW